MNQTLHKQVMLNFLTELNQKSIDYILKGGTALFLCYGLDRFSTDIDLDSKRNLNTFISDFCKRNGFEVYFKKNTNTVDRYTIHYNKSEIDDILKIEISHRKYELKKPNITKINNILTYDINTLFAMKLTAGLNRSKIRDLYDICFIYNNYKNELDSKGLFMLENFLNEKGEDYFQYLMKTQGEDAVINTSRFEDLYLKLLYDFDKSKQATKNLDTKDKDEHIIK